MNIAAIKQFVCWTEICKFYWHSLNWATIQHFSMAVVNHIGNSSKTKLIVTRAVPNILFGPNSRPNSVFVFGQTVAVRPMLACSCMKPQKQTLPWARHSKQLLLVCSKRKTAAHRCQVVIRTCKNGIRFCHQCVAEGSVNLLKNICD